MTGGDKLALPALEATNPIGFLAALGVLVELDQADREATLRWTDDLVPHAVVTGSDSLNELVALLDSGREHWLGSPVLSWPDDDPLDEVKPRPDELTRWAKSIEETDDQAASCLWSGLLAEGALDEEGKAKPTHLHFAAGQQRFLKTARELAAGVDTSRLREAVEGPWRYDSSLKAFRWDVRGERIHALSGTRPGRTSPLGVPGADWLAWIGLSCFLVVNRGGHLETTACDRDWKRSACRWPVWTVPIGLATVRSLLADPQLTGDERQRRTDSEWLRARGVARVFQSPIRRTDQGGYGSFGAPTTLADTSVT